MAKAGGEAERVAAHSAAGRAKAELASAKVEASAATLAANKVRGVEKCGPKCASVKATEVAAIARIHEAEKALVAAEGGAVTEAAIKAPEWLLPVSMEVGSIFLIACGFGLGRRGEKNVGNGGSVDVPRSVVDSVVVPVPAGLTKRQIAARKGWETRRTNAAVKAGKVVRMA